MQNRAPNRNYNTLKKKPHNRKPFNKKRVVKEALPSDQVKIVLFNKPFDVLCQFTDDQNRATLADFVDLDGPLLLSKDRDEPLIYRNSHVMPPKPELWG